MPKVEYSSDEDVHDRRQAWDTASAASGSAAKRRAHKAASKASTQTSNTMRESQSFLEAHKSQLTVAAAVAGGLAVAGIVVNKVLGSKRSQPKAEPPKGVHTPKKLAARRKRSG